MSILSSTNTGKLAFSPKTKEELIQIIENEIEKNGLNCSLNHINTSKITDMSYLFRGSNFDGDISKWDVSNVRNMRRMFSYSHFTGENGGISKWNVRRVKDMYEMFENSHFNSDISDWVADYGCSVGFMFFRCLIKSKYKPRFYKFD